MKVAGVLLLILGIVLLVGGFIGAINNSGPPRSLCRMADEDQKVAEQAIREFEAIDPAKGTIRERYELQKKADEKVKIYQHSGKLCREGKSITAFWFNSSLAVAGFGILLSIVGFFSFFIGRKKETALTLL